MSPSSEPRAGPQVAASAERDDEQQAVVRQAITRVRSGRATAHDDEVAVEEPLEIRVVASDADGPVARSVAVTMRTPGQDFELAVGFLFTEGILVGPGDVVRISYCLGEQLVDQQFNVVNVELAAEATFDEGKLTRNFFMSSSCGVCGKATLESLGASGCRPVRADRRRIAESVLYRLHDWLRRSQSVFDRTGGVHAAGLFRFDGRMVAVREDVGRHNAVDKVVGGRFLAGALPLAGHVLAVSGRASFEILQKAAMAGIPVLAAVGAPSSLAIATADEFGLTLVGFLGSDHFNVYTHQNRLKLDQARS